MNHTQLFYWLLTLSFSNWALAQTPHAVVAQFSEADRAGRVPPAARVDDARKVTETTSPANRLYWPLSDSHEERVVESRYKRQRLDSIAPGREEQDSVLATKSTAAGPMGARTLESPAAPARTFDPLRPSNVSPFPFDERQAGDEQDRCASPNEPDSSGLPALVRYVHFQATAADSNDSQAPSHTTKDSRNMDQDLRTELTFYANFDDGTDAVFAKGDRQLYSAPSYREQDAALPGLQGDDVILDKQGGRVGGALRFTKKNTKAIFYKAQGNVSFDAAAWTGTVSFWLSLDPETELAPDYVDPIQVTDKNYNDSAVWVDFTKDDRPRLFRLGVFGNLKDWNPRNIGPDQNPAFLNRLVVVKQPPFARNKWTHIAITYAKLGGNGSAALYVDGKLQGRTPVIREPFNWDLSRSAIRLGLNYTGLFDDLMVFRRVLTDDEVARLAEGKW